MAEYENDTVLEDIDDDTSVEADPGEQTTKATVRGARGTRRPVQITRAGGDTLDREVRRADRRDRPAHPPAHRITRPAIGTDLVAIAATIVAGKKQPAVTTLLSLADKAEDPPYQAMLHAMDLGRDEVKQTWQLLATAQLGGGLGRTAVEGLCRGGRRREGRRQADRCGPFPPRGSRGARTPMKKSANRRAPANRGLWEDADSQYNPDAQSIRTSERRGKFLRVLLRATVFGLFPVACICAIVAIGVLVSAQNLTKATVSSVDTNSSRGKSVAWTTVQDWLAADPSPLPDGRIMSWDGFQRWEPPKPKSDRDKPLGYEYETHRFTLQRGNACTPRACRSSSTVRPRPRSEPRTSPRSRSSPTSRTRPPGSTRRTPPPATRSTRPSRNGRPRSPAATRRTCAASSGTRTPRTSTSPHGRRRIRRRRPGRQGRLPGEEGRPGRGAGQDPDARPGPGAILVGRAGAHRGAEEPGGAEKTPQAITYDLLVQDADTANAYVTAWGRSRRGATPDPRT